MYCWWHAELCMLTVRCTRIVLKVSYTVHCTCIMLKVGYTVCCTCIVLKVSYTVHCTCIMLKVSYTVRCMCIVLKVSYIADKDYLQSQCASRLPEINYNVIWKILVWNYFPFCSAVYCIWWPHMCGDEAVVSFYATELIIMMSYWSHIKVIYFV